MSQHKKACKTCPFIKTVEPGALGGSPAEVYVGQISGPFWVPCHSCVDYSDPDWKTNYETPQCVGVAIMRAQCGADKVVPRTLFSLPEDADDRVFESVAHFWAHHKQVHLAEAQKVIEGQSVGMLLAEFKRAGVKIIPATCLEDQVQ